DGPPGHAIRSAAAPARGGAAVAGGEPEPRAPWAAARRPAVSELTRWFEHEASRAERIVVLEDALLSGRFWPYFAYRLRYFGLRWAIASILQVVKVVVLRDLFGGDAFIS